MKFSVTLEQIANHLNGELRGDKDSIISGIATLQDAREGQLSFLANQQYKKYLDKTQATAVLLKREDVDLFSRGVIVVDDPYLAFAKISHWFDLKPHAPVGIHKSAHIADDAIVHPTCTIGPGVVIESGVLLEERVAIGANSFIGARCQIKADSWLAPRVTLYHDVKIGQRAIVQSGAVIGSEGFGFANDKGVWVKIAQIGSVVIGNDVEVGANTTIDRGALSDTIIGDGVKLDNQIMIAHNVQIGDNTAMAACCGISGSTKIGRNCMIAGGVGMVGHIEVCDNVFVTGMTMVTRSIKEPGIYSSGTAMQPASEWKKNVARFRHLDEIAKRLQYLEKNFNSFAQEVSGTSTKSEY